MNSTSNNPVRYRKFVLPPDLSANDTYEDGLVACYQDVFAGPPWFEDWPAEQVRTDIRNELQKPSSCWIAVNSKARSVEEAVVGFSWGYLHQPCRVS